MNEKIVKYYLGVDVGATKTQAILADDRGQVVGFGECGPGNHEVVGYPGLIAALQDVTRQAVKQADISIAQIVGAGFGVAGYDWPAELQPTLEAIATLGLTAPVEVVNDTVVGLVAGAEEGWGVAVVAGTSNNCRGRDRQGREGRVTGNGSWFGEYGGAGELVTWAMHAVSRAWSRRGPVTRLSEAFVEWCGARNVDDLFEGLVMEHYSLDASAARLVFDVANQGDLVAQEAIRWAGEELANLAIGVIRQLSFEDLAFDVVLVGSLYNGGDLLIEPMRSAIQVVAPGARLVRLNAPPVVGGVLLGMEKAGLSIPSYRSKLIASTRQFNQALQMIDNEGDGV
jgi:N-acetylglucosamine kinase-like BadF-type ATPase